MSHTVGCDRTHWAFGNVSAMIQLGPSRSTWRARNGQSRALFRGFRGVSTDDGLVKLWHRPCNMVDEPTENIMQTTTTNRAKTLIALAIMGAGLFVTTGCTTVAPYERAKLAHPTMAANDLAGPGEEHLRAVTEGAIGGSAGAGSGCGCN
ncbi:MAG TPA: DUF4266 domain-containing protein [Polyangiaceae bacterium]|nr:DUF4266 domain-containing protein [Polyangiaceae bacterium]